MYKSKSLMLTTALFSSLTVFLIAVTDAQQPARTAQEQKRSLPTCGLGKQKLNNSQIKRARAYTRREKTLFLKTRASKTTGIRPETIQRTEVTVLVVYTPLVTQYLGGKPAVQQHVRNAAQQANTSFQNSAVPLDIKVVGIEEVSFPESHDFDTDLERLAFGAEGQQVREMRENTKADQVALIVDDGNYGGLAFGLHPRWDVAGQPSPLDPTQFNYWAQRAYFEIRDDCIDQSYKCFAHELGHNLGAGHDNEDWLRLYWDSHGYSFNPPNDNPDEGLIGTIMSYKGANHRKLYFSNPSVSYGGKATGANGYYNARGIIASMDMVARYK